MKNFIKNHKNVAIAGGILILLFVIFIIVFFIAPLFSSNKYGDRLDDIEDHKISNSTINEIKDAVKENEGVSDVSYHNEGRILNFIITLDSEIDLEEAKTYAEDVTDNISSKNKKYYDIEVFIKTKEDSDVYPVIGYHGKGTKKFSWSNVGESNE